MKSLNIAVSCTEGGVYDMKMTLSYKWGNKNNLSGGKATTRRDR